MTFSEIDLLSSCARDDMIVRSSSPLLSNVQMASFSEYMQNLVSYGIVQKCPEIKGFVRFADR